MSQAEGLAIGVEYSDASVLRLAHAHGFAYNLRPEAAETAMGTLTYSDTFTAFGEIISATGAMHETFRFRFSTKYQDEATGFCYYGYRFYSPTMGRFINRDPIEENGGLNLYGFVGNDPVNLYDELGLFGAGRQYAKTHGFIAVEVLGMPIDQLIQKPVPFGHSDFAGGNRFDFVKEDVDPLSGPVFSAWNHFLDLKEAAKNAKEAADKCVCDRNKFERALHRVQDYFSHTKAGYQVRPFLVWKSLGFGHLFAGVFGDDPDDNISAWNAADSETVGLIKIWDDNKCGRKQP